MVNKFKAQMVACVSHLWRMYLGLILLLRLLSSWVDFLLIRKQVFI